MTYIYPRANEGKESIARLDEFGVADDIIKEREKGLTKAQAIGPVLDGSNDVSTFNEVWDDIESERQSLRSISPGSYSTESAWKTALSKVQKYLVVNDWIAGVKAETGKTWTELKKESEI